MAHENQISKIAKRALQDSKLQQLQAPSAVTAARTEKQLTGNSLNSVSEKISEKFESDVANDVSTVTR